MPSPWLKYLKEKSAALVYGPAMAVFVLAALACNAQATATPVPTPVPTAAPTVTPVPTIEPTATPKPTPTPVSDSDPPPLLNYYPWNPPTNFYGEPVYGGTLRINFDEPLEHANVWGAASRMTDMFRIPTGATLVMEDPYDSSGPLIPDLVAGWEVHEGHDGVTFYFREGATWHNGEPFVCEDARFSFETMITGEEITSSYTSSYMRSRLAHVILEEMVCFDDSTLEIKFYGPTAIPLHAFSHYRALIFNKAWFQEGGEDAMFTDVSMGIGPFKWLEGQRVGVDEQSFEKNADYFIPELPYVDELVIYGILDDSARQAAHLAHQTDWVWVYDWSGDWIQQYQAYVDHDQIMTVIRPTRDSYRLWINAHNPPFENVKVRQAIVMGIDRDAVIREVKGGYGSVGGFGYSPGSPWELPQEQLCSVPGWCQSEDMEATRADALAILEAEGFDFDRTYVFHVSGDPYEQFHPMFLQEQLASLGIKTDFDIMETIIPFRQWEPSDFNLGSHTVTADDPNAGVAEHLDCDLPPNYWLTYSPCDESIVALLDRAQVETDPAKRLALAHEIELAAMGQYNGFPLYWVQEAAAFWPEVRGYVHFPHRRGSFLKFMHLWIDPAHKDDTGFSGQTTGVPGGT